MKNLFRQPLSAAQRILIWAGSGLILGLLMTQLDLEARRVGMFVDLMDLIHAPALFLAEIMHAGGHFIGGRIRSIRGLRRPNVSPAPNGLAVDFGSLECIPYGIVLEWTIVGTITGIVWGLWRSRVTSQKQGWKPKV